MSEPTFTTKLSSHHVLIAVTGIMITLGCSALVFSTWSAFQAVVPDQLGVSHTTWALYVTILYFASAVTSPVIGNLLSKYDVRIILSVSAVLVGCGFLLISIARAIWAFYIAGVMMGVGEVALLWLTVPTLCNNWFNKGAGTIIGISMAFTGIGGAVWLQVFNSLYAAGTSVWTIYFIWGIITLVTSLPFTLFCVRRTPQEVGCLPYGAPLTLSGKPEGVKAVKAYKTPVFYAVLVFAGMVNLINIVANQFPTYTKQLEGVPFDALAVGLMMATVMMVAQAICKVALGVVADKNIKISFVATFVAGISGVILVWFGTASSFILYAGAAIFGFFYAACMVLTPCIVRRLFGTLEYPKIYSTISLFINLCGAVAPTFWAFMGQMGFSIVFTVATILLVIACLLGSFALLSARKIQALWTREDHKPTKTIEMPEAALGTNAEAERKATAL